jgi:hypothetical protein
MRENARAVMTPARRLNRQAGYVQIGRSRLTF